MLRTANIYHILGASIFTLACASWAIGKTFTDLGDRLAKTSDVFKDKEFFKEHPEAHEERVEASHV